MLPPYPTAIPPLLQFRILLAPPLKIPQPTTLPNQLLKHPPNPHPSNRTTLHPRYPKFLPLPLALFPTDHPLVPKVSHVAYQNHRWLGAALGGTLCHFLGTPYWKIFRNCTNSEDFPSFSTSKKSREFVGRIWRFLQKLFCHHGLCP